MRLFPFALLAATACTDGTGSEDACVPVDCQDPTCVSEPECQVPSAMSQDSALVFTGREIECRAGGFPFPYDVPDCATRFTVDMTERTEGNLCGACDVTYEGTFSYSQDTCSELIGTQAPTSGAWGFVFHDGTERELWTEVDGAWVLSETMTGADGVFSLSVGDRVDQDPPDCNNGVQYVGDLTLDVTFTDADSR